jgi:hypothetical protein
MDFTIDVVVVSALIVGITETLKELFSLEGNKVRIVTVLLGFFFYGLAFAMNQALIPEAAHVWIKLVVYSLGGAAAAMGYFDLWTKYHGAERNTPDA